jgi:rubrerythrin
MDPMVQRMTEGLRKAMLAEQEGRHFYMMAARSTQDQQGRQTFERLAEEELDHFNFLRTQYGSLLKTGSIDEQVKLGPKKFTGEHPIFSAELKRRVGGAHFEMTALSVGIQLELSAVTFYRAEAEAASDPKVEAFYTQLVAWELGHLQVLQREVDALKEGYWHDANFEPF